MQGTLWVQDHPWAQPEMLQGSFGVCLHLAFTWPGWRLFPFIGNHSCLYMMGIPAMGDNFQGPSHTRPLCGGTVGHARVPVNLLVS